MKNMMFLPVVLLLALSGVPALAKSDNGNGNGQFKGAPGPILGAGLPIFLVGGGIYWLVCRRKGASADCAAPHSEWPIDPQTGPK
jgi:hypothetical protein